MNDNKLENIIKSVDAPHADLNAKKRAVNLAMQTFSDEQKKNEKKFQGFSLLSRLMGNSTNETRRETMEQKTRKKLVYGGMATAMAVVLIAGTTLMQTQNAIVNYGSADSLAPISEIKTRTESMIASVGSADLEAQDAEKNQGRSAIPLPTAPQLSQQPAPSGSSDKADPLQRWRKLQEQNGANQVVQEREVAKNKRDSFMPLVQEQQSTQESLILHTPNVEFADDSVTTFYQDAGRDAFESIEANPFKQVSEEPVSTFSADVDTASYAFVRREINHGRLPSKDAVRTEEIINYFNYNYAGPDDKKTPFKASVSITDSPWASQKKLMHIGIKGYDIDATTRKSNLVFLLDTSGSMNAPDKLPLLINSFKLMLDSLNPNDTVAIAVYAGSAGTVLEPTKVSEKEKIVSALNNLRAGGGTAGAAGIELAYTLAEQNFDAEAVNRVILATDGDFNVGITNRDKLKEFVEKKRKSGVFLSVLGFGKGNYNDHMMQTLAQNGNGVAAYIDTLNEARKVLVEESSSTLFTIAKDVKLQVEFNPATVQEYRLVGYETRALKREDFNNDKVDAGDIGAGHTVTAIYEFTPIGAQGSVDPLRYSSQQNTATQDTRKIESSSSEYAFLKMRYKLPNEDISKLVTTPVTQDQWAALAPTSCGPDEDCIESIQPDARFSIAAASFAQMLKGGHYTGTMTYDDIIQLAQTAKGDDPYGYRSEFIQMVRLAQALDR